MWLGCEPTNLHNSTLRGGGWSTADLHLAHQEKGRSGWNKKVKGMKLPLIEPLIEPNLLLLNYQFCSMT